MKLKRVDKNKYQSPRENQGSGAMNPFNEELGAQKEDDSNQMQDSYHDTGSGWIPFHAKDKRPIRLSLWDNMEVPGWSDRGESWGGNENAMGNAPFRNYDNAPSYDRMKWPNGKTMKDLERTRPQTEDEDVAEMKVLFPEARSRKGILKISSDDNYWMAETVKQINYVNNAFSKKLGEVYGGFWRLLQPIKDGNTLRCQWASGSGINIRKFLLYIRYNAGSDMYSISSGAYDSAKDEEVTLVSWTDDVFVDMLMDPNIWIIGE